MTVKTRCHVPTALLSDAEVLELRRTARKKGRPDVPYHAKRLGVSTSCIEKAILGRSYKHLNDQEPPFTTNVNREAVAKEVRRLYLEEKKSYKQIQKIMGIAISSVSKYCKDIVRNHHIAQTPELIAQTRELYLTDLTTAELVKKIGVRQKLIHDWCRDLFEAKKRLQTQRRSELAANQQQRINREVSGPQVLTDAQVIEARREARASGVKDWKIASAKYKVAYSTMSCAMRGISFKHLNDQEPPIARGELKNKTGVRRRKPNAQPRRVNKHAAIAHLLEEAVQLRRSDPTKWTYGAVGKWLAEKTGINYRAGPTSVMLLRVDPTLKELEKTPYIHPDSPEKRQKRIDTARQKRLQEQESLRLLMEKEDRRERELAKVSREQFLRETTKLGGVHRGS